MHLFSKLIQLIVGCIIWIAKHFGIQGILILLFIIEIPITLFMYSEITQDYKFEDRYILKAKSELTGISREEAGTYVDIDDSDYVGCYTYQLEIQNTYFEELRYPLLHDAKNMYVVKDSPSYYLYHDYKNYYYDVSKGDQNKFGCSEAIPAYAKLTIPCIVSGNFYHLSREEREELEIIIGPLTDDMTEDNTVILALPSDS